MSYEEEQERRLRKIGRNPEADEATSYTNRRLSQIMTEEIARIPKAEKDAIKRNVLNSQPPDTSDRIINAEIAEGLRDSVKNRAMRRLEEEKRLNVGFKRARLNPSALRGNTAPIPCGACQLQNIDTSHTRRMLTYLVETTLRDMGIHTRVIHQFPLSELMLKPFTINSLRSCMASWNSDLETLHVIHEKYKVLESLKIPIETSDVAEWVKKIQNNQILNEQWLQSMKGHLNQFLRPSLLKH